MWIDIDAPTNGQDGPDYDLACPSCRGRCIGKTYSRGVYGTYLNPYFGYCVKRIVCSRCGVVDELTSGPSLAHQYWFRIAMGKNVLWAANETRIRQVRVVLVGDQDRNQSAFYTLPKWLIKGKNRSVAIRKIGQMLIDPTLRGTANF